MPSETAANVVALWNPPCLDCHEPLPYQIRENVYGAQRYCNACVTKGQQPRLEASGLPAAFIDGTKSLDTYKATTPSQQKALEAVRAIATHASLVHPWLFLSGDTGTGKTHLAAGAVAARIRSKENAWASFTTFERLLLSIQRTFNAPAGTESQFDIIDRLSSVPLLVIDDLGVETPTTFAVGVLYSILNERANQARRTVLTTNYSGIDLAARLASKIDDDLPVKRIIDRIREMGVAVKVEGPNHRRRA